MAVIRWLWERVKGAVNSWVEALILAGFIALALLVWRLLRSHLSDDVALPTWLVAVIVGVVVAVVAIQGLRLRERRGDVEGILAAAVGIEQVRAWTAAYAEHLTEILYAFQRVLGGQIPGVTTREWVEDGILQPARDLLRARQTEDVRLSILAPNEAGDEFVMEFAAGHTLDSKRNFRLPIAFSFSGGAYKDNLILWSGDLASDERYTRHPKATPDRDYNSMICVPIRKGEQPVAVFNTIFTASNAFDEADLIYVRLLGAVIELVWQLAGGPGGEEAL
jgi:hypothetical protein